MPRLPDNFKWSDFEDPARCSFCRGPISAEDQANGLVLTVNVMPRVSLHPETGKPVGMLQPDGPRKRYLHGRPCAEQYANKKLVCDKCNYWRMSKSGAGLCLCTCHPPANTVDCYFRDGDMNRVEDSRHVR